jgi:hypothetical protein
VGCSIDADLMFVVTEFGDAAIPAGELVLQPDGGDVV